MTQRLRGVQREEMQAQVLAYLQKNGPRPMSEILFALDPVMTAHFVYRTVRELLEAGKITAQKVQLSTTVRHEDRSQVVPYTAAVYDVARPRRRSPKKSAARSPAEGENRPDKSKVRQK